MISRGILTTKADVWAHLFPFEHCVYWYLVRHMREHIKGKKPVERLGHSKDGHPTGAGFLVQKSLPFIRAYPVPENIIAYFPWRDGTDRETGLVWGEQVMDWLLSLGYIRPSAWEVRRLEKMSEQNDFGDFALEFKPMPLIEIKTELLISENLFVQTQEKGHRVHIRKTDSGQIEHKFVMALPLEKD